MTIHLRAASRFSFESVATNTDAINSVHPHSAGCALLCHDSQSQPDEIFLLSSILPPASNLQPVVQPTQPCFRSAPRDNEGVRRSTTLRSTAGRRQPSIRSETVRIDRSQQFPLTAFPSTNFARIPARSSRKGRKRRYRLALRNPHNGPAAPALPWKFACPL